MTDLDGRIGEGWGGVGRAAAPSAGPKGLRPGRRGRRRRGGGGAGGAPRRAAGPVLGGGVGPSAAVEAGWGAFPFDPPLRVAWDPEPRTRQEATVVVVH